MCLGLHLQQQRVLIKFHLVVVALALIVALAHQQKHRDSNQVLMVVMRRDRAKVPNVPQILFDDDDDGVADEVTPGKGKRPKKCTSEVWNYFTKKKMVVEVNGKKYEQL